LTGTEVDLHAYYGFNHGIPGAFNGGITTLEDLTGDTDGTLHYFDLFVFQSLFHLILSFVYWSMSFLQREVIDCYIVSV